MLKLGVLDQVHISEGQTAGQALQEATRLIQETERLGYSRFWVSEHHATRALAFSSPEVLIAHLAAATSTIRVGSGGIMLPHYSAYKVAENFKLLEALHPGRIDVGLGRAPGGMPIATRALQADKFVDVNKYPQQVLDLAGFLRDKQPSGHPFEGLLTSPSIPSAPPIWMLGSSGESARMAAQLGSAYAFAQFFGTPGGEEAMRYYQTHFQPSKLLGDKPQAMIAALVICADTDEEANALATSSDLFFLQLSTGQQLLNLPSVQTAYDYPYTEADYLRIKHTRQTRVVGSPEKVKQQLIELSGAYNVNEILINSPIHNYEARILSYKLLSELFDLNISSHG
ncbi:LLM class flavin-dependent oxidoreductase [Paenibacillus sp. 2TAB19]|uniref:LLM class flavin-dependent oxidoreductase n=1 Tax=Paenibacillus sp. 2TAB19 TaxID=3233003 RepID=UPI003F959811